VRPYLKKKKKKKITKKWLVEWLKVQGLNSNPSTAKKKKVAKIINKTVPY
jgi:tRNA A22 N-methylase